MPKKEKRAESVLKSCATSEFLSLACTHGGTSQICSKQIFLTAKV